MSWWRWLIGSRPSCGSLMDDPEVQSCIQAHEQALSANATAQSEWREATAIQDLTKATTRSIVRNLVIQQRERT